MSVDEDGLRAGTEAAVAPPATGGETASPTITPVLVAQLLAEGEWLPVFVHVIEHPDARVLVDTGMTELHPAVADMDPRLVPLSEQADFDLAGIDVVINTHLHFDHAGNNSLFPGATIVVQREQYEFADGHPSFPNQYWNLPELHYELVDGRAEVLPGVEVLPTPGHVPGHQSVVLTLPETGTVILSGDAVHVAASYDLDNWDGHMDPAAARVSAHMLRRLAADRQAVLLLGHEPAQVAEYPRFPHVYR
jgi:N-acyl homoserine lactone hydrolase